MSANRVPHYEYDYERTTNFWDVLNALRYGFKHLPKEQNPHTQQSYHQRLKTKDTLDEMGKLIFEMLTMKVLPDFNFLTTMMYFMKRKNLHHYLLNIYFIIQSAGMADTPTYNRMLALISKSAKHSLKTAIDLLQTAISKQLANVNTCKMTLQKALRVKNVDINEVINIYYQASISGITNEDTYQIMVSIVAKNKNCDRETAHGILQDLLYKLTVTEQTEVVDKTNHINASTTTSVLAPDQTVPDDILTEKAQPNCFRFFTRTICTGAAVTTAAIICYNML